MYTTLDYIAWLLPYALAGYVSLRGLLTLLMGRFTCSDQSQVKGAGAVVVGVLLLPPLLLCFFINPSLQRRKEVAEAWQIQKQRRELRSELQQRESELREKRRRLRGPGRPEGYWKKLKQLPLEEQKRELQRIDKENRERNKKLKPIQDELNRVKQELRNLRTSSSSNPTTSLRTEKVLAVAGPVVWYGICWLIAWLLASSTETLSDQNP